MKEGEEYIPKRGSHFPWLRKNMPLFLKGLKAKSICNDDIILTYGHNCYSFYHVWNHFSIPFEHGVAVYLLSYLNLWSKEVRETKKGWVEPAKWVLDNYGRFKDFLPEPTKGRSDGTQAQGHISKKSGVVEAPKTGQ